MTTTQAALASLSGASLSSVKTWSSSHTGDPTSIKGISITSPGTAYGVPYGPIGDPFIGTPAQPGWAQPLSPYISPPFNPPPFGPTFPGLPQLEPDFSKINEAIRKAARDALEKEALKKMVNEMDEAGKIKFVLLFPDLIDLIDNPSQAVKDALEMIKL